MWIYRGLSNGESRSNHPKPGESVKPSIDGDADSVRAGGDGDEANQNRGADISDEPVCTAEPVAKND